MQNEKQAGPSSNSSLDQSDNTPSDHKAGEAGVALATIQSSNQPAEAGSVAIPADSVLAGLPLQLDVTIPIPSFRVGGLLGLDKGAVIESGWPHTDDVPVWCGGSQLAWTEFEVVNDKLAVRLTRIG